MLAQSGLHERCGRTLNGVANLANIAGGFIKDVKISAVRQNVMLRAVLSHNPRTWISQRAFMLRERASLTLTGYISISSLGSRFPLGLIKAAVASVGRYWCSTAGGVAVSHNGDSVPKTNIGLKNGDSAAANPHELIFTICHIKKQIRGAVACCFAKAAH